VSGHGLTAAQAGFSRAVGLNSRNSLSFAPIYPRKLSAPFPPGLRALAIAIGSPSKPFAIGKLQVKFIFLACLLL
jgi:hypothetical protein